MNINNKSKFEILDEKIKQLQAQKQKILNAEKEKARKQRTKNLIEMGALIQKYFKENHNLDVENAEQLSQQLYKKQSNNINNTNQQKTPE